MLEGIDISHWQGDVNWSGVQHNRESCGVPTFVVLKCTEGEVYRDVKYLRNKAGRLHPVWISAWGISLLPQQ